MSLWNGKTEPRLRDKLKSVKINDGDKEDYDVDILKAELKRLEAENVYLHKQVASQTQFMQTVIIELIAAIKEKPQPKSAVQSYLENKGTAANSIKPAGKLP